MYMFFGTKKAITSIIDTFHFLQFFNEGRRFRFGAIGHKPVILVMTGMGMVHFSNFLILGYD